MSNQSGKLLPRRDHIRQSVADILFTPLGSRVMRRDYGSLLSRLIDQPLNAGTVARVRAAVVDALVRWEDRLRIDSIEFSAAASALVLDIAGTDDSGTPVRMQLPIPGTGGQIQ